MTLILYYHPFSSYCQKALIALYEKQLEFNLYRVDLGNEHEKAGLATIWPYAKFPVLHDTEARVTIPESSPIVEYVDGLSDKGPRLLPEASRAEDLRSVRLWDRIIDNYLHTPMQKIVGDRLRPEGQRDPYGVADARATIQTTYRLLENRMPEDGWLGGAEFSLADCAAAPPLFYCAVVARFGSDYPKLARYFGRLMARPSFMRCVEEAREFRHFFPSDEGDAPWPEYVRSESAPEPATDASSRVTF